METLPTEITDKIFDQIFCENPRNLYGLRGVSKSWKDMVDRCTKRLLKVWCKKCSDEIPEDTLDDFIRTRVPKSWKKYCSYKLAVPHIARDIYEYKNEFPNLVGRPHYTEVCPIDPPGAYRRIYNYAINDNYFAINCYYLFGPGEERQAVRIYALDDLTYCLREYIYPNRWVKIDLYTTDNREFIIFSQQDTLNSYSLFSEFLVNENLIPANLPGARYDKQFCLERYICNYQK